MLTIVGCTGRKSTGSRGKAYKPRATDTLYTLKRALSIFAYEPVKALTIIDSAVIVGNLGEMEADRNRAYIYSQTLMGEQLDSVMGWTNGERLDTAKAIGERLLQQSSEMPEEDVLAFRQDVLEMLVYTARMQKDTTRRLQRAQQLVEVCRAQGAETEARRSEAEVAATLCYMGQEERGLARLDSVIALLDGESGRFNELDALIIALKRKIGVLIALGRDAEILPSSRRILERLNDYEQHPADYHDGSYREPANKTARADYIAFYRSQAQNFITAAYATIGEAGNTNETFEQLEHIVRDATAREHAARYRALEQQMRRQEAEDRALHSQIITIVISILLMITLAILGWYGHQKRAISKKNRYLAEQISETLKYRELYWDEHSHNVQPISITDSLSTLTDEQLFQHINDIIVSEQLFLDSRFGRQTLVDRFQLSKNRLGAVFSKGSNHDSLSDYIQTLRLEYAAQLLIKQPEASITKVAAQSGFSSCHYFSTRFHMHFGMSPTDFRDARHSDV